MIPDRTNSTGEFVEDPKQTNHFIYKENILGIYLNYERKLTEKLSGKLEPDMK
jgi:hypothetical protein